MIRPRPAAMLVWFEGSRGISASLSCSQKFMRPSETLEVSAGQSRLLSRGAADSNKLSPPEVIRHNPPTLIKTKSIHLSGLQGSPSPNALGSKIICDDPNFLMHENKKGAQIITQQT